MDSADRVLGWRADCAIARQEVLNAAAVLSDHLATHSGPVINLCEDRLRFTTALLAARHGGRLTLLPPNSAPGMVADLARRDEGAWILDDERVVAHTADPRATAHAHGEVAKPSGCPGVSLFTSGSTGQPTEHIRTWSQLEAGAEALSAALGVDHGPPCNILATVPAQHMFGLEASVMLPLMGPHAVDAGRPLFPEDVRCALERLPEPRALVSTPLHLRRCLDADIAFPHVDLVVSATAPLEAALASRVEAAFGGVLREIFGSTETGALATRRTSRDRFWHPLPGAALSRSGDTWVATGRHFPPATLSDSFTVHADGCFTHEGRSGDMIKIAGKRGSLAEVTRALTSLHGVEDAVVLPRRQGGERVRLMAIVVAPGVGAAEIREHLRRRLDAAFLPRPLVHADHIPRDEVGKVTTAALDKLLDEVGITP